MILNLHDDDDNDEGGDVIVAAAAADDDDDDGGGDDDDGDDGDDRKGQHLRWPISVLRKGEYGILSEKLKPYRRRSSQTLRLGYKNLILIRESCHDILYHALIDINAICFYDIKMSCHNSFRRHPNKGPRNLSIWLSDIKAIYHPCMSPDI